MKARTVRQGNRYILYDADAVGEVPANLFDPGWLSRQGRLVGEAVGRGAVHFFALGDMECVLRHYLRGGAVARLNHDRYLWLGLGRSRAWREWYLLARMSRMGLPVPTPVAARVERNGVWYRADLITQRIPHGHSLAKRLGQAALSDEAWRDIGVCIGRFHRAGIFHADLNAHNILVDDEGCPYVIDFDRGRPRAGDGAWQLENLKRLRRSLNKLAARGTVFHFGDREWRLLSDGYANHQGRAV